MAKMVLVGGKEDVGFSIAKISDCITEISMYHKLLIYMLKALPFVILWRGHFRIPIVAIRMSREKKFYLKRTTIYFPLHSVISFISGITLVERPFLIIPYFLQLLPG